MVLEEAKEKTLRLGARSLPSCTAGRTTSGLNNKTHTTSRMQICAILLDMHLLSMIHRLGNAWMPILGCLFKCRFAHLLSLRTTTNDWMQVWIASLNAYLIIKQGDMVLKKN